MWPPTFVRDGEECEWTRTKHPSSSYPPTHRARDYSTFFTDPPFDTLPSPPIFLFFCWTRSCGVRIKMTSYLLIVIRINYIITILIYSAWCDNGITAPTFHALFFLNYTRCKNLTHLTLQKFEIRIFFSSISRFFDQLSSLPFRFRIRRARERVEEECIAERDRRNRCETATPDRRRRYIIRSNRIESSSSAIDSRFGRAGGRN